MYYRLGSIIEVKVGDSVCVKVEENGSKCGGCSGYSEGTDIIMVRIARQATH